MPLDTIVSMVAKDRLVRSVWNQAPQSGGHMAGGFLYLRPPIKEADLIS